MPNEIFGTFSTSSTRKPTFNSLNYLKPLPPAIGARFGGSNETTFHVVEMFSDRSLLTQDDDGGASLLDDLFGRYNVVKTVEKTWFAYPRLAPVTEPERDYAPVRPDQGLYYVNAMERLVSTMETEVRFLPAFLSGVSLDLLELPTTKTRERGVLIRNNYVRAYQTVSAFNIVSLLLNDLYGYTPPSSWAEWPEEEEQ